LAPKVEITRVASDTATGQFAVASLDGLLTLDDVALPTDENRPPRRQPQLGQSALLADAFRLVARQCGDEIVLATGKKSITYRTVASAAASVAGWLTRQEWFTSGARVGVLLPNCAEYLAAFYGTLWAGGVTVPLPPDVATARFDRVAQLCDVKAVLTTARVASRRHDLKDRSVESIVPDRRATIDVPAGEPLKVDGQTLAMIVFTSGSSGDPKGVMLSDQNLLANAMSILDYLPIDADDRALVALPFCYAFGNSILQTHVLAGASLIIDGSMTFPNTIVKALDRHQATSFSSVPEGFRALLNQSSLGNQTLPHLRYMSVAGGALDSPSARKMAERIRPAEFFVMYGQTEATARLAWLPPERLVDKAGSIGQPVYGAELKVADIEGRIVPPGTVGELIARGPNVMLGYYNDPAATAKILSGDWLHTGDLAVMDDDGYFFIRGRKSDLVKIQGIRVHPREIEDSLAAHFPNHQIYVVAFGDGSTSRLALFFEPGTDRQLVSQSRQTCGRELPMAFVPTVIDVLDEIPLTLAGKLDRRALSRLAESAASRVKSA
jgi:long-chain acyl-CoA synthetase